MVLSRQWVTCFPAFSSPRVFRYVPCVVSHNNVVLCSAIRLCCFPGVQDTGYSSQIYLSLSLWENIVVGPLSVTYDDDDDDVCCRSENTNRKCERTTCFAICFKGFYTRIDSLHTSKTHELPNRCHLRHRTFRAFLCRPHLDAYDSPQFFNIEFFFLLNSENSFNIELMTYTDRITRSILLFPAMGIVYLRNGVFACFCGLTSPNRISCLTWVTSRA